MRYILPLLLLVGCGMPSKFTSRCGAHYLGESGTGMDMSGWTDDTFQRAEDIFVETFAAIVTDERFTQAGICAKLNGWNFDTNPKAVWIDQLDRRIAGLTNCVVSLSTTNNVDWYKSSYYHEAAHAVQRCDPIPTNDPTVDAMHANWGKDHIYEAVDRSFGVR